jgi:deferrochelatase/peroxidase EfeB
MKRRAFLAGAASTLVGMTGCTTPQDQGPTNTVVTVAGRKQPRGLHQLGIHEPPPAEVVLAALDVAVPSLDQVGELLQRLTHRIQVLRSSSGTGDMLTITAAAGATLFSRRLGLAELRPRRLTEMPPFPNDALDQNWCHGDLLLQVCAGRPGAARAAMGRLLDEAVTLGRSRWSLGGFRPENQVTPTGTAITRNLFGFREGIGNPNPADPALMDQLVWVQPGGNEPSWTAGGTYQVVRLIRMATELWDAEPVERQEDVFGRHKQSGAPLAGKREDQAPNFAVDPDGRITPLDAHIRRANPRTPETEANRILRRSYSYRRGRDGAGRPDEGLLFVCFQQDLERGFATIQRRLRGEALEKYVLPFGGGYFFVLPAAPPGGYLGQQLLEAAR